MCFDLFLPESFLKNPKFIGARNKTNMMLKQQTEEDRSPKVFQDQEKRLLIYFDLKKTYI
jgi:hypothetical protein